MVKVSKTLPGIALALVFAAGCSMGTPAGDVRAETNETGARAATAYAANRTGKVKDNAPVFYDTVYIDGDDYWSVNTNTDFEVYANDIFGFSLAPNLKMDPNVNSPLTKAVKIEVAAYWLEWQGNQKKNQSLAYTNPISLNFTSGEETMYRSDSASFMPALDTSAVRRDPYAAQVFTQTAAMPPYRVVPAGGSLNCADDAKKMRFESSEDTGSVNLRVGGKWNQIEPGNYFTMEVRFWADDTSGYGRLLQVHVVKVYFMGSVKMNMGGTWANNYGQTPIMRSSMRSTNIYNVDGCEGVVEIRELHRTFGTTTDAGILLGSKRVRADMTSFPILSIPGSEKMTLNGQYVVYFRRENPNVLNEFRQEGGMIYIPC